METLFYSYGEFRNWFSILGWRKIWKRERVIAYDFLVIVLSRRRVRLGLAISLVRNLTKRSCLEWNRIHVSFSLARHQVLEYSRSERNSSCTTTDGIGKLTGQFSHLPLSERPNQWAKVLGEPQGSCRAPNDGKHKLANFHSESFGSCRSLPLCDSADGRSCVAQ